MNIIQEKIKLEYEDYLQKGFCQKARDLNKIVGSGFFDDKNPHYFTGKLDSKVVTINLNPKSNKKRETKNLFENFSSFWDNYENFGVRNYASRKWPPQKFDIKQVMFFKETGLLNLIEEKNIIDKYINLERVIDNKLQWELIPYGSDEFSFSKIGKENIKSYLEEAIKVVTLFPRDYIIFKGAVFRDLLHFDNIKKTLDSTFKLKKKDGTFAKKENYQLINIIIDNELPATILPHYAYHITPLINYGKKMIELYPKV